MPVFNPQGGGSGSSSVGPGTINTVAKFATTTTVGNSTITDDGTIVTVNTASVFGAIVANDNSVNFLRITGTLPAVPTAGVDGMRLSITGAGSAAQNQRGFTVFMNAGYTGGNFTGAAVLSNSSAGTGNNLFSTLANAGFYAESIGGAGSGTNVGGMYNTGAALNNYGIWANANGNSALNLGVAGFANPTGTTYVAGYFGLQIATPTYTSAALIADNGAAAASIFIARDNGTATFTIADGGAITSTGVITVATTAGFNSFLATNSLTNGGTSLELRNDAGTASYALLRQYGSTASATAFGQALANFTALFADGANSNGMVIGTFTADPVIIGTNNAAAISIASGGIVTFANVLRLADGTVGGPSVSFTSATGTGIYYSGGMNFSLAGTAQYVMGSEGWRLKSTLGIAWSSGDPTVSASDTIITRGGVAAIQLGVAASATPVNYVIQGQGGSGTDISGASIALASGNSTGAGVPADLFFVTSVPIATGTGAQTNGNRYRILGKYTTLTESVNTEFAQIAVSTGTVTGGSIVYTIEANDATDYQALTGSVPFSIVNKSGSSMFITLGTDSQASAVSTGTLTGTLTLIDGGSINAKFRMSATSSLTQTVLRINCQIQKNFGTGAIAAI